MTADTRRFAAELAVILADTRHGDRVPEIADELRRLLDERDRPAAPRPGTTGPWSQHDTWIIAYPDQFQAPGRAPLAVLPEALDLLAPEANGVHVLPCYPWSSDDGYAVIDPLAIRDDYGTWDDIAALGRGRRVMLDAVVNHLSTESPWFERFLAGDPEFADAFVTVDPDTDLSGVVRPRSLPLLTAFEAVDGTRWVWTTFSADQVDVNIADPTMLLRLLDVLVRYAEAGASAIRLDAVGFLGKQPGTPCIHLPQTHAAVRLMRLALDRHHPDVLLVTETNVPHEENISYFGGPDEREAQAVYQFSLPPLVLHTMHTGDATALSAWAARNLEGRHDTDAATDPAPTTFLNFLASHDGIGLRPVEGLLAPDEVAAMADRVTAIGGVVNTRSTPDGERPYELCTTWFDAVALGNEERGVAHHLASHAIMLLLPGIAAVYAHSLVGSSNDHEALRGTGTGRSLNRARFTDVADLADPAPSSRQARVNTGMRELMQLRRSSPAFHPDAPFEVADPVAGLFRFHRGRDDDRVLVEVNVATGEVDGLEVGGWRVGPAPEEARHVP